jgi:hypothetical protein
VVGVCEVGGLVVQWWCQVGELIRGKPKDTDAKKTILKKYIVLIFTKQWLYLNVPNHDRVMLSLPLWVHGRPTSVAMWNEH